MFSGIKLNDVIITKIKRINPSINKDKCFWAAVECTKVLFTSLIQEEYEPLDVSTIAANQDSECQALIKRNTKTKKTIKNRQELLTYLMEIPANTVMIVTNSEGDHYYNILKDNKSCCYIIDGDRKGLWKINNHEDLIHSVKGWDEEEIEFDYFQCKPIVKYYADSEHSEDSAQFNSNQNTDEEISTTPIKIFFIMSPTLVNDEFKPRLNEPKADDNEYQERFNIDDFY